MAIELLSAAVTPATTTDSRMQHNNIDFHLPNIEIHTKLPNSSKEIVWGEMSYRILVEQANQIYEEIANFKKNLFISYHQGEQGRI